MSGTKLIPEKITSPFQLMAAWFSMLVLLVGVLLAAAIKIEKPEWAAGYLVICSTILIMVVLGCVTLMLTKFRPHLQDGKVRSVVTVNRKICSRHTPWPKQHRG